MGTIGFVATQVSFLQDMWPVEKQFIKPGSSVNVCFSFDKGDDDGKLVRRPHQNNG
jgi:hypothetical protein